MRTNIYPAACAIVGQSFVDPTDGEVFRRVQNGWVTPSGAFYWSLGASVARLVPLPE